MPSLPIDQTLQDIAKMESAFDQTSCADREPFIKYPDTGNPPTIDFNIPEGTAFTTYGYLLKYLSPDVFKDFTKQVPVNNYFDMMESMSTEQAAQLFSNGEPASQPPPFYVAHMLPGQMLANEVAAQQQQAGNHGVAYGAHPYSSSPHLNVTAAQKAAAAGPMLLQQAQSRPISQLADFAKQNFRPVLTYRLANMAPITKYVARPPLPVPRITVIEEYTTASYLGNYGAGRVVKTFTLAPGERTTVSVRTYEDKSSSASRSDNMLDSFSQSGAIELDTLMQLEQGNMVSNSDTTGGSGSNFATNTDTKNSNSSSGISGSLNFGIGSIGGGYGQSQAEVQDSSSGFTNNYDYNHTGVRASNINTLNNALNKHVQQSNAARQIDVNTSTTDTASSGEEDSTVREFMNYNKSRTLNIVFRQLLQEYTTITYLSNLKFQYTNGYSESTRIVDISNLSNMLMDIINPDNVNDVMCTLLQPYCSVLNYDDNFLSLVSELAIPVGTCNFQYLTCKARSEVLYRINPACTDSYSDDVIDVTVNGVILSVKKQTLQTSSVIADALLGAGEALDCFNQKAQDADTMASYINNLAAMQSVENSIQETAEASAVAAQKIQVVTQQMKLIDTITPPTDQATAYKKVFGSCCPTPQYTGGCGCGCGGGCGCADETPE